MIEIDRWITILKEIVIVIMILVVSVSIVTIIKVHACL